MKKLPPKLSKWLNGKKISQVDVSSQSESDCYIKAGQYKSYVFDESKSCAGCKADDYVTMINPPLVGIVSTALSKGILGNRYIPVSKSG